MLRKRMLLQIAVTICMSMFAGTALAGMWGEFKNFSADIETTMKQGVHASKMYYKDTKMRMETSEKGHSSITIMRPDKKVMWMVMPQEKSYMEMSLDMNKDMQSKLYDPNIKVDKQFIANEVVEKHPTKKYRMTIITDGKKENTGHVWEATDLSNFPVKYESEDKSVTTIYRNIKTGGVSDSMFEVPSGYTKMEMPMMPQGMGGGRPKKPRN